MADKKRVFQCFQREILQNQRTPYLGTFKIFDEEFDIEFGTLGKKLQIR